MLEPRGRPIGPESQGPGLAETRAHAPAAAEPPGGPAVDLADTLASSRPPAAAQARAPGRSAVAETVLRSGDLASTLAGGPEAPAEVPPRIGRYVLVDRLGAGAMGVVYSAYDPELDRKIALKLVRARPGVDAHEVGGLTWLMREAQAMARLSHPNVIQVHDVGHLEGSLFIAMELADGTGFSAWLATPRPWREIVARFIEVGRGLAAAHAAGLVHRDFKPDNVLLGRDGRPRVTDFGLARAATREASGPAPALDAALSASVLTTNITQVGTLLGTPAYMAPEQFTGGAVDARSDLFAFCVALYEALHGERPFAGETLAELQRAVLRGQVREAPAGRRIPPWLRRALLRGLRVDPAERWPSMDALLEVLARDPGRALRRRLAGLGLVVAVAVAASVLWIRADAPTRRCLAAVDRAAEIWGPARKDALREAFVATGAPAAAATWTGVAAVIDRHMSEWTGASRAACAADEGDELHARHAALRRGCLDRRLREVEALTGVFAAADAAVVARSVDALAALSPISGCAEVDALLRQPEPPGDPASAAAALAVRRSLARVGALEHAGRYGDARLEAAAAIGLAEGARYPPALAEALLARGRAEARGDAVADARASIFAALTLARAHRHDEVARDAAIELIAVVGQQQALLAEADLFAELAAADLARAPSPLAEARLLLHRGDLRWAQGRYDACFADLRRSLEQSRALLGDDHPSAALAEQHLGRLLWAQGGKDEATRLLQDSRRRLAALLGDDHPQLADALRQEGNVYWIGRDLDRALATYEQALAIAERHQLVADIPKILLNIGATHGVRGDHVAARRYFLRTLELEEQRLGAEHPGLLPVLDNLVDLTAAAGERGRARELALRALAIRRGTLGDDHPELGRSLITLGDLALKEGDAAEALRLFEEAVDRRRPVRVHPILLARALEGLARALVLAGGDRARARESADEAAALFAGEGEYGAVELAELEAWRAEVGLSP